MNIDRSVMAWTAIFVVFFALLYLLGDVLTPFVAGMAVAYFLDPLADRLESWGASRTLAVVIILGLFFVILIGLLLLLVPALIGQLGAFAEHLPGYAQYLWQHAQPLLVKLREQISLPDLGAAVGGKFGDALKLSADLASNLLWGGAAVINILALVFITPLLSFYLLRDWDKLVAKIDSWFPRPARQTLRQLAAETDQTLAGWVRGQAIVCLILAAFYGVALSLTGLDFGLLVGMASGIFSFIPFIGVGLGLIIGLGIAFIQFSHWLPIALVAAIFLVGQFVEGNFLTPKLVGRRVGLHPVWVIFALMAGGSLFGFAGILLAVPTAAVIGVVLRHLMARYMSGALYLGSPDEDGAGEETDKNI